MKIELVYGDAKQQTLLALEVAPQSCIGDVLRQVMPATITAEVAVGIFGQIFNLEKVLQPGDRIEVYQALRIDPKEARQQLAKAMQKPIRPSRRKRGKTRFSATALLSSI